jgi:alpha-L-fucosidase
MRTLVALNSAILTGAYVLPNERQLDFMEMETIQFMHFNVDTAWKPPESFLRGNNPTYHNCWLQNTGISHDYQTEGTYPCLSPRIFNPEALDVEQWMEAAVEMGMKEVAVGST